MYKTRSLSIILALFFLLSSLNAQIKIKELPEKDLTKVDSLFFDLNSSRRIIPLNQGWYIFVPGSGEKKVKVSVPSIFEGKEDLTYEKDVYFSADQIKNKSYTLEFLGVDYRADILLNDMVIHKHPGGVHPFRVLLPSDLLKPNQNNTITVNVYFELDDISTIPVLQRFLFPMMKGGIFRDVFLRETNKICISDFKVSYKLNDKLTEASIKVSPRIINQAPVNKKDTLIYNYKLLCSITKDDFSKTVSAELGDLRKIESRESELNFTISKPLLWSPNNNESYDLSLALMVDDSTQVDLSSRRISFYDVKVSNNQLLFNNTPFNIKGTTYFYSQSESGGLISYDKIVKDLKLIKDTGFNVIRFAKKLPHPFTLYAMEEIGLLAMVELPLNSIPDEVVAQNDFVSRVNNQLNLMVDGYSKYSSVFAYGLGGGYLGSSAEQFSFLENSASHLKEISEKLIYSSFLNLPESKIKYLDLYGIELFSSTENQLANLSTKISTNDLVEFISETTYPSFNGNSNGYLNDNSYEAAAKYFTDILDFAFDNNLNGTVINTFYDYSGDYKSFYAGYNKNNLYALGLLPDAGSIDRISYKVVKSKLTDGDKITIPIGTTKDDSPILFILIGLGLSIFMALLINSKRKFREDAGRALIRPYNFYADIRDNRLLSGLQTNILMFILAGSSSLLIINILYFLRTNILLEKFLLSFGSESLINAVIYIAWHPLNGYIIMFVLSIAAFFILSIIFKVFSFFLKNKVFFSSIYYSVIWALLPLALLLPVELVLYRILIADVINIYIYIFIGLYLLWLLQRMLKGIYVIFDVQPIGVYFYSILFILILFGGIVLYYQLVNSTVYYILRSFAEYKFL